ncbi:Diuretic hormone 45, partial [Stegodyphus mimosarum]
MLCFTSFWSSLLMVVCMILLTQESCCESYQRMASYPLSQFEEQSSFRRNHLKEAEDSFPKMGLDVFGSESQEDRSRSQEDNDSSAASFNEVSLVDIPMSHMSPLVKRRKGPTLSVVNPLEILRQRLMLDLAQRRIHENQQQIVANAQLLENIGKRSSMPILTRPAHQNFESLRGEKYQP